MVNRRFQPRQCTRGKQQRRDEQADGEPDRIIAQQRGCDDPRRELSAGNLNCNEQRAEREDHEGERQRDDRLQHHLRHREAPGPNGHPAGPRVDRGRQAYGHLIEQKSYERNDPKRRPNVAPEAIPLVPVHLASLDHTNAAPAPGSLLLGTHSRLPSATKDNGSLPRSTGFPGSRRVADFAACAKSMGAPRDPDRCVPPASRELFRSHAAPPRCRWCWRCGPPARAGVAGSP